MKGFPVKQGPVKLSNVVIVKIDGEYICKAYVDGKRYEVGDYFTDDRDDAKQTKEAMLKHGSK